MDEGERTDVSNGVRLCTIYFVGGPQITCFRRRSERRVSLGSPNIFYLVRLQGLLRLAPAGGDEGLCGQRVFKASDDSLILYTHLVSPYTYAASKTRNNQPRMPCLSYQPGVRPPASIGNCSHSSGNSSPSYVIHTWGSRRLRLI